VIKGFGLLVLRVGTQLRGGRVYVERAMLTSNRLGICYGDRGGSLKRDCVCFDRTTLVSIGLEI
jgi:hypothetical protein